MEKDVEIDLQPLRLELTNPRCKPLVAKVDSIVRELSDEDNIHDAQTTGDWIRALLSYMVMWMGIHGGEFRYLKNELLRESRRLCETLAPFLSADETFTQEGYNP